MVCVCLLCRLLVAAVKSTFSVMDLQEGGHEGVEKPVTVLLSQMLLQEVNAQAEKGCCLVLLYYRLVFCIIVQLYVYIYLLFV